MNLLSALRPWQIATLIAVLIIAAVATYVVYTSVTGTDSIKLTEEQQLIPIQRGDLIDQISISGSVNFPERENITFGSDGVVSDVLVSEGERVLAGDVVAILDAETVASLERAVVEARAELRDAKEDLADLLTPSELALAEAQQRAVAAEDTLDGAVEALDAIINPSRLQVAELEAQIASANQSLSQAEDALADYLDPVTGLSLAQAQIGVVDAESALADLEARPTELEIAEASAKIADADVNLQAATETLADYQAGADEDELAVAVRETATAEANLSNARANLRVAQRDWAVKTEEAQDNLDSAADDYTETFERWLGISPGPEGADPDYETALETFGVDLDVLFSDTSRYTGLNYPPTGSPPDDKTTPWNESHIYAWLNFAVADLVATCDPGDIPPFGVCVEEEFRIAGDAYQTAIDNKAEMDASASSALTAAAASVDSAESALVSANEVLADLEEPPDQFILEDLRADVRVAAAQLAEAKQEFTDLTQATDMLVIDERLRQIALARSNLEDAREQLLELTAPIDAVTVDHLSAQVDLARANLAEMQDQYLELLSGEDHPKYPQALQEVAVARLTLDERLEELEQLSTEPDAIDLALLTARVGAAETLLEQSEQRLADASLKAPWDGFVSRIDVDGGQEVMATDVVVALVDTSIVEVDGSVDEIDVLNVEIGAAAEVTMDALPGRTLTGSVSFVGAEANSDQGVVSYPVRVRFDLPRDLQAPAGLSAVASITINEEIGVLLAPINAIRGSFTQPTVDVMVDGQIVERPVTLGSSDEFWTVVTSGLEEGDTVVGSTVSSGDRPNVTFGPGGGGRRGPR